MLRVLSSTRDRLVCLLLSGIAIISLPAMALAADARLPALQIRYARDVVYATDPSTQLSCDIYSPTCEPGETLPAVLVIHGGAWSTGSKRLMAGYATQLAQAGIVAVAIDYHHAPQSKFPTQLDDVRDALIWIRENADTYSIDAKRLGIFGYSAGGHLACLIATLQDEPMDRLLTTSNWSQSDPRWRRLPDVTAVVAGGPPCEFRNLPPNNSGLAYFLGGTRADSPAVYEAASPAAFASKGDCPIGFIHGERDLIVPIKSSLSLYQAQLAAGVQSEFVVIEKQGHFVAFMHPKTSDALLEYMERHLNAKGPSAQ